MHVMGAAELKKSQQKFDPEHRLQQTIKINSFGVSVALLGLMQVIDSPHEKKIHTEMKTK